MQGKKHYEDRLFTQVQLSRRIPKGNYYKKLKPELKLNFIYKLTKNYYGVGGKKSLDPIVFFKLCLVKKKEGITSDKKLIDFCQVRLDILYFLNYNIDEKLPYFGTLSHTRRLFPEELITSINEKIEDQVNKIIPKESD